MIILPVLQFFSVETYAVYLFWSAIIFGWLFQFLRR